MIGKIIVAKRNITGNTGINFFTKNKTYKIIKSDIDPFVYIATSNSGNEHRMSEPWLLRNFIIIATPATKILYGDNK